MGEDETLAQSDLAGARAASMQPPERPGVPGYVLGQCLGAGSFGEVWSARQLSTGQEVAVKLLLHGGVSYLERELSRLRAVSDHPHVVSLIDANLDHAPPFVITPLLAGSLESEPAPEVARVALWLEQVAGALEFVHARGLLHCDLKPANLLLDREGQVRVVDFGQAVSVQEGQMALGTLFFMPPEQARPGAVPAAGWDVYALGATFYRLLAGKLPRESAALRDFLGSQGSLRDTLEHYCEELPRQPLIPLRQLNPAVDADLATILEHCLELDPGLRYATMGAVLADLKNRRGPYPLSCRPRTSTDALVRFWKRNRALSLAVGLLLVTIGLAFAGISWQRDRALSEEVRSRERLAEFLFQSGLTAGGMEAVLRLAEASDLGPEESSLARLTDPAERARAEHAVMVRRVAAQAYLTACPRLLGVRPVRMASLPEVSLTAEGWALEGEDGKVSLVDPSGQTVQSFPGQEACFDPTGQKLAVRSGDGVQVFTRQGKPAPDGGFARQLSDPELVAGSHGQLARVGPGQISFLPGASVEGDRVAFSPLGPALVTEPFRARLVETATGKPLWERQTSTREVGATCFSPDGSLVAVALTMAIGSQIEVRETETGEPQGEPVQTEYTVLDMDFDATGRVLAGACSDRKIRLWQLGGFPDQLQPVAWAAPLQKAPVEWVRFQGDSLWALSADEESSWLYHWQLPQPPAVLAELESLPLGLRVAGDRWLARTNHRLRVWRGSSLERDETLPELDDAWLVGDRVLALEASDSLQEWGPGSQRHHYQLPGRLQALRPDGRAALLDTLQEVELSTGRVLRQQTGAGAEHPMVYSPDGTWAAAAATGRDRVVPLFRPDRSGFTTQLRLMGLSIGPDKASLLAWTDNLEGSAAVYLSRPGLERPLTFRHGAWVTQAALSPDARWVLTTSLDGTARLLRAETLRPASAALTHGGAGLSGGGFSPDGNRVFTQDELGRLRLWDRQTGLPLSPLLPQPREVEPVFLKDGRLVLAWGKKLVPWSLTPAEPGMVERARHWTGLSLEDLP